MKDISPPELKHRNEAVAEKIFAAEKYVSWVRGAVIVFNSLVYVFLMDKAGTIPWLAYSIVVIASLYALFVIAFQPYRKYHIFLASYFTYSTDALLITLWLLATGGYESPFFVLWYISLIAVAFRFSAKVIWLTSFIYAFCYLGLLTGVNELDNDPVDLVVRIAYIFCIGFLGTLMSRETLEQTRQKKEMQQLAHEAREAEEMLKVQTQLYHNLLKAQSEMGEGVSITEGSRFIYVNDALCRIYGYTEEELLTIPSFLDLIAPEEQEALKMRLTERLKGGVMTEGGHTIVIRKDGRRIHIAYSVKAMETGGNKQLFSIVRDITEEVRSKEALLQSTLDLARSQDLDRKKDEFIGVASHELKTPLTSIKGYVQLLERVLEEDPVNTDSARLYVKKAQHHIDRLNGLISDLLDVSRIQAGKLMFNITEFDISELVSEVVEGMQHSTKQHNIIIENNRSLQIKGDRIRLEQVLMNLISNAIKYSPKADRIIINVSREGNAVKVAVKDFGIGIPKADLRHVFDRFFRVENIVSKIPGLGIGLYISGEIINRHKGKIWAESEEGKGTTFYFTLPVE